MCGICGIFRVKSNVSPAEILSMTNRIRHRGPDDEGYVAFNTREGKVTPLGGSDSKIYLPNILSFKENADLFLAHRRLAIIDLSPAGHQPMNRGEYWITYNGELYNYLELRRDLEKRGHQFHSNTDTEVLLAAYAEWGEECLNQFDGMWSFVIYDRIRNCLFGSRDRFGVKPFYYIHNPDKFFTFASEAKAFTVLPEFRGVVRSESVFDYLAFGVEHWEDGTTFLEEVMELPPSHSFLYDLSQKSLQVRRYYMLPYHAGTGWESFSDKKATEYINYVRQLVFSAIRRHLLSDVPVGSCLSGGIDSSSIFGVVGSLLQKENIVQLGERPRAFTACYHDKTIDESAWAKLAVEYTSGKWHTVYPQAEDLIADLEDLVYTQDFPFGSTSIYAQYRVMKLAKEQGVTVLLDGQGGDELFTGYLPYYTVFFREMFNKGAWRDLSGEWKHLQNAPIDKAAIVKGLLVSGLRQFLPRTVEKLAYTSRNPILAYVAPELKKRHFSTSLDRLKSRVSTIRSLNEMLFLLMTSTSLPTLLRYEDRNSMRFHIESRTPFADDRKLIEEVFAIPATYKIHNGYSKWLLRESMKDILPEKIYKRQDKIGFATPEYQWLYPHKEYFKSLFDSSLAEYLDVAKIKHEWNMLMDRQPRNGVLPVWRLINLAMWVKCFDEYNEPLERVMPGQFSSMLSNKTNASH